MSKPYVTIITFSGERPCGTWHAIFFMLGLERERQPFCTMCSVLFSGKSRDCWIIHVLRSTSRVMHSWVKKVFVGFNLLGNVEQRGLPYILLKGLSTLLYAQRYGSRFSFSRSANLDNAQSCHAAIFTPLHVRSSYQSHFFSSCHLLVFAANYFDYGCNSCFV